ncbi:MAG: apolipoprotein N-acyltransferase [Acidimicrobiia bacterium]|nr:apolipoprotein N-acyltransferase [Acidimicrobiia bacterium]
MIPYTAALAGALLMWLAFPPFDVGILAFVAPAPFLWGLRRVETGAGALAVGFVYGAVFFGLLLSWIAVLGMVAWIPLTLWLGTLSAAYGLLVWSFRAWPPARWWLIVVGGWALWELIKAYVPFGGFPWGSLGYAAAGNPGFIGSVQWIGPSGWTVLAVGVAAGIVLVVEDTEQWRLLVDPSVVVLMLVLAGLLFPARADGDTVMAAIVQGSSPCPQVHCQNENRRILEQHLELSQSIPRDTVDLVVWPENSFGSPYDPIGNEEVDQDFKVEAQRLGAYMLVSGTHVVDSESFVNVNIVYSPIGTEVGRYDKTHPVPFGEYVPLRNLFSFIPQLDQVPRDMIPGDEAVVFPIRDGVLGSVISFEGAFIRHIRDQAKAGSELMVIATNESSYGPDAPASDQLIEMARVNAAAIGQDLILAAITGKSTFITAEGNVGEKTELLEQTYIVDQVQFRSAGPTVYTRIGDWATLVALAGAAAGIFTPGPGRPEGGLRQRRTGP